MSCIYGMFHPHNHSESRLSVGYTTVDKNTSSCQQQYEGKDATSLLDIDLNFKSVVDIEESGLHWDYRFNQLQGIDVLKEDERTLIVSDSIEITEKSEQWISKTVDYSDGGLEMMTRDQMDEDYTAKKQT